MGPLQGLRILDIADESAVFAGRLLADLGAEVIRVEPSQGDRVRQLSPFLSDQAGVERGLHHLFHNAGKKSVVLDRKTPEGMAQWNQLVASADALIETEALDHSALIELNPQLIHATISPFGLDGPWSKRKGNDLIASASSGLAWVSGAPRDPPTQAGADQSYKMAGLVAAAGLLIALHGRKRSSQSGGTHLDISVQESTAITVCQTANPAIYRWTGEITNRPGVAAVHRTKDGKYVTMFAPPEKADDFLVWAKEEGFEVPAKEDIEKRIKGIPWSHTLNRSLASKYERDELLEKAWAHNIPGLPVQTFDDMDACEHFIETKQFKDVKHEGLGETLSYPRSPVDGISQASIGQAPLHGEHTEEVLSALDKLEQTKNRSPLNMAMALQGIRVVDFTWVIAGPMGTRILSHFGAEVIRVESGSRAIRENFPDGHKDQNFGAFRNLLNSGKRSLTVDPRTPRGRELLLKLIETADVVTNNYRPGVMEEMGFDFETLKKAKPNIISLHMPGCGLVGPWRDKGSFGTMVTAAAGLNHISGFPGRGPRGMGIPYPDFSSPYILAILVMAALREREQSGQPSQIDLNQLSATVGLLGVEWLHYKSTGKVPPPRANRDLNWSPHGIYRSQGEDEWLALAVETDEQWSALCEILGRGELSKEARFIGVQNRKENEDEIDEIISLWSKNQDKWEAAVLIQSKGIPAAAVENIADSMDKDPQLKRHFEVVSHASAPEVEIPIAGEPIQVAGLRRKMGRVPLYGQDTDYVLKDILGCSESEIAEYRENKIVL